MSDDDKKAAQEKAQELAKRAETVRDMGARRVRIELRLRRREEPSR